MKKAVFLGILMIFAVILSASFSLAGKPANSEKGVEEELLTAVADFINSPAEEDLTKFRKNLQLLQSLAEKAGWREIDEVSIFLEKTKKEVEEKSRELALSYLITMHQECRDECPPEAKKKLEGIYEEWKFQQDVRLGRFFYVIRAFQPRIAVLGRKAEADKIRNSRLLRFVAEIKPEDSDEEVLRKRQIGITEFERRKGR